MLDPYNRKGRILAAALERAANKSWAEVTLLDIAEAANLPLVGAARASSPARPTSSPLCCAPSTTRS